MKCKIFAAAGHVQEMYSKCHVSVILEMCRTDQISGTAGNVQEFMCPCLNCT